MNLSFRQGMLDGVPIALGYLTVSFGFGLLAVQLGLPAWSAVFTSLTNVTSAGQTAGVKIIAAGGGILELILTQLVINIRYALMSLSLSQKLDGSFTLSRRILLAFGVTDEIYGVAMSRRGPINARYMAGLIVVPVIGWVGGTLVGAIAGQALPAIVTGAMGIVLYAMFLAIILPPARQSRPVLFAVALAAGFSTAFTYLLPMVSGGFAVIISALAASLIAAWVFPIDLRGNT